MNHSESSFDGEVDFVNFPHLLHNEKDYFNHHLNKYKKVAGLIENLKPKKILDVAAGTGAFWAILPKGKYEVHAVDIAPEFVQTMLDRGIRAKICDINSDSLPYDDNSFDLVIFDSFLEHSLAPKKILGEVRRVVKPTGSVIIVTPNATCIKTRWRFMRGDNVFGGIIDNLLNRSYMLRCAVCYDEVNLRRAVKDIFQINHLEFLDETSHDAPKVTMKVLRFLSYLIPRFRDVILCEATPIGLSGTKKAATL